MGVQIYVVIRPHQVSILVAAVCLLVEFYRKLRVLLHWGFFRTQISHEQMLISVTNGFRVGG